MTSTDKTTRKSYSLDLKLSVIEAINKGEKKVDVARKFNVTKGMITKWARAEDELKKARVENVSLTRKRKREETLPDLEQELFDWFVLKREQKVEISGDILIEKAKFLANEFYGDSEIANQFSRGWLQKFQKRYNISYKRQHGEKADADVPAANSWKTTVMPVILEEFTPDKIYNADETGLYYRATPDGTLAAKGEEVSGGKKKKERLTVLVASNMTGSDKLPLFVIGKSKNPRCFKNKNVPISYEANKSAWMTRPIFQNWCIKIDDKMRRKNIKICLLLDRCPAHPPEMNLTNVKIVYLPANTTSIIQPMDAGII